MGGERIEEEEEEEESKLRVYRSITSFLTSLGLFSLPPPPPLLLSLAFLHILSASSCDQLCAAVSIRLY